LDVRPAEGVAVSRNRRVKLLVLYVLMFGLASAAGATHVPDYIFSISGVVTTEDKTPIKNAEITLKVDGPVYKGTELITIVKSVTDDTGGFAFMYMSHKRGEKYTITVRKEGFEPQTVKVSL
jgi:Carboxypeptidase regulatory-like domain